MHRSRRGCDLYIPESWVTVGLGNREGPVAWCVRLGCPKLLFPDEQPPSTGGGGHISSGQVHCSPERNGRCYLSDRIYPNTAPEQSTSWTRPSQQGRQSAVARLRLPVDRTSDTSSQACVSGDSSDVRPPAGNRCLKTVAFARPEAADCRCVLSAGELQARPAGQPTCASATVADTEQKPVAERARS